MRRDAGRVGLDKADDKVGVVDGSDWIKNQIQLQSLPLDDLGLDFYHLSENIHKARRVVYGEEDPKDKQAPGSVWVSTMLHVAKHEGYEKLRDDLQKWKGTLQGTSHLKAAEQVLNYVTDRREMIQYPKFIDLGRQIGSGPTESMCKATTQRIKGGGKRWDADNAESIMALEAAGAKWRLEGLLGHPAFHSRLNLPENFLLLLSDDVAALLTLTAAVGSEPLPTLFAVAGGFLLKLVRPETRRFPGVVRLRNLAADLFLPFDALLLPALFDDEAAGLTRDRGLVFLPGGSVLAYDPAAALPLASLVELPRPPQRNWAPLPPRPDRPDRLREVRLDLPETREQMLTAASLDIGAEAPRPAQAGPMSTATGRAQAWLGRLLIRLGNLFSWRGLARSGANLVRGALERVPRISEELLGRQEAALRDLLRQFQEGNLEDALRRALPLGGDGVRGGTPADNANLPTHPLRYSLGELLAEGKRGASVWFGGGQVQAKLAEEYRKAAAAAAARGDHRRAAFIYFRLLADYRSAAAVLARGGLYRDAALIYLERLHEPLMAARAFANAGDIDRAVVLYRRHGQHAEAGDLLCQAGETDAALVEYGLAADKLARTGNHLAAGDLLRERAGRPDLAIPHYRAGWEIRHYGGSLPCILRLLEGESEVPAFLTLASVAGDWYARPEAAEAEAGQFFNALARLADRPALARVRSELRDQALLGLAGRLRGGVALRTAPGPIVSALLGQEEVWPVPVVHDAETAYRAAYQATPAALACRLPTPSDSLRLGVGVVTAACQAPETGMVFVGFRDGALARFDPRSGGVVRQPGVGKSVTRLASDANGQTVVALLGRRTQNFDLIAFRVGDVFGDRRSIFLPGEAPSYRLTPLLEDGTFGLYSARDRAVFLLLAADLEGRDKPIPAAGDEDTPMAVHLLPIVPEENNQISALTVHAWGLHHLTNDQITDYERGSRVTPAAHLVCEDALRVRHQPHPVIELVRCGDDGRCYWATGGNWHASKYCAPTPVISSTPTARPGPADRATSPPRCCNPATWPPSMPTASIGCTPRWAS